MVMMSRSARGARRHRTMPQERRQETDAHGTRPDFAARSCRALHGDAFVADSHRFRNRVRVQRRWTAAV